MLALHALAEACEDSVVRLHNVLLAGDGVGLELEFLECSLKVAIANRPLPREEQSRVFTGVRSLQPIPGVNVRAMFLQD